MPDTNNYYVTDSKGKWITDLGDRYDRAGARHRAQGESRTRSGPVNVMSEGVRMDTYENGRKVK